MLWMHISVTAALLVFLGMIPSMIHVIQYSRGAYLSHDAAVAAEDKAVLGLFSLIYVSSASGPSSMPAAAASPDIASRAGGESSG